MTETIDITVLQAATVLVTMEEDNNYSGNKNCGESKLPVW